MPTPRTLARVRRALLGWYAVEHRDWPWRATRDPWAVLLSEVMLQQTQAARVAARFPSLLASFPTPRAMAEAGDAAVLAAWSGLGYNRRALALRRAAVAISRDGWPGDVAGLERLPGVGPYTARAVAGLAFGQPIGVVDTNVRRWLIRRFGMPSGAPHRDLQALADALASPARDGAEAAAWVHAGMELGGRICTARAPRCGACPIAAGCPSRGRAAAVPVARQAPVPGSRRAARGAALRALAAADGHRLPTAMVEDLLGRQAAATIDDLRRDGLVHRSQGSLHLGGEGPDDAATIRS